MRNMLLSKLDCDLQVTKITGHYKYGQPIYCREKKHSRCILSSDSTIEIHNQMQDFQTSEISKELLPIQPQLGLYFI